MGDNGDKYMHRNIPELLVLFGCYFPTLSSYFPDYRSYYKQCYYHLKN